MTITSFPINTSPLSSIGSELASVIDGLVGNASWRYGVTGLSYNALTGVLTLMNSDGSSRQVTISAGISADADNVLSLGSDGKPKLDRVIDGGGAA